MSQITQKRGALAAQHLALRAIPGGLWRRLKPWRLRCASWPADDEGQSDSSAGSRTGHRHGRGAVGGNEALAHRAARNCKKTRTSLPKTDSPSMPDWHGNPARMRVGGILHGATKKPRPADLRSHPGQRQEPACMPQPSDLPFNTQESRTCMPDRTIAIPDWIGQAVSQRPAPTGFIRNHPGRSENYRRRHHHRRRS